MSVCVVTPRQNCAARSILTNSSTHSLTHPLSCFPVDTHTQATHPLPPSLTLTHSLIHTLLLHTHTAPALVETAMRYANMERRLGCTDRAVAALDACIAANKVWGCVCVCVCVSVCVCVCVCVRACVSVSVCGFVVCWWVGARGVFVCACVQIRFQDIPLSSTSAPGVSGA